MSHINSFIGIRIVSTRVKSKNLLLLDNLYLNTYSKYLVDIAKKNYQKQFKHYNMPENLCSSEAKLDDVATSSIDIAKYVSKYAVL